jgi:hypothetical protein
VQASKHLLIFGAALVIGGCGSSPPAKTGTTTAASPPVAAPAPAGAASCALATQSANTCRIKDPIFGSKRMICELFVGGTPDQPFVYPYQLDMPVLSDKSMPVIFVWKLLDRGYQFTDRNSGPTQPGMSAAFTDGATASDDDGESASGGPERRYRWRFTHPGRAAEYKYIMQFQTKDPLDETKLVTVSCDPTIKSSAD